MVGGYRLCCLGFSIGLLFGNGIPLVTGLWVVEFIS